MMIPAESSGVGARRARSWTIIPPIDAPTAWKRGQTESLHQADGVVGQRLEIVGHRLHLQPEHEPAEHGLHVGRAELLVAGGLAAVAVVHPYNRIALGDEALAKVVGPAATAKGEAGDEEHGRVRRLRRLRLREETGAGVEAVVADDARGLAVGRREEHQRHQRVNRFEAAMKTRW